MERRKRSFGLLWIWILVPTLAFGVGFLLVYDGGKNPKGAWVALKESVFGKAKPSDRATSSLAKEKGKPKEGVKEHDHDRDHDHDEDASQSPSAKAPGQQIHQESASAQDERGYQLTVAGGKRTPETLETLEEIQSVAYNAGTCKKYEIKGALGAAVKIDSKDWTQVMSTFHEAKRELGAWLVLNEKKLGREITQKLDRRAASVRLVRPPFEDEPHLSYRGIGTFVSAENSEKGDEAPGVIKLGAGFIDLVKADRARAKFELARLIAQSWSPCGKTDEPSPVFKEFVSCVDAPLAQETCKPQTYSESAWAISTAVALMASPPGCEIPAFAEPKSFSCLKTYQGSRQFQAMYNADGHLNIVPAAPATASQPKADQVKTTKAHPVKTKTVKPKKSAVKGW